MTATRRIAGHWLRGCRCCAANQRGNYECCRIVHSGHSYHFVVAAWRVKKAESRDNLSKAGFTLSWVAALGVEGRTIWIVDAQGYGKHFIVRADEKRTAFLELEAAVSIQ